MSERKRRKKRPSDKRSGGTAESVNEVQFAPIADETRKRYLNYAMSVIMARALPDVRDGLKPVQRRILYAMYSDLRLTADSKRQKCARITGEVTGKYHPHGNVAAYDTLARMAQDFTLREPLIDGQGNFGSIFGLKPAAERYTEARLMPISERLMDELRQETVDNKATYDAERVEPVVLPAQFPNLLVNGASGIAVGMATNIPPHNLSEVVKACGLLIDNRDMTVAEVMRRAIKGPDFPLGGRIVTDRTELRKIYEEGRGSIKVRAEWGFDKDGKKEVSDRLVVSSLPHGVETGPLMEILGGIAENSKLPQLEAAVDETDGEHGLRIVLHLKKGADPNAVMAYLFKNSNLEQNFGYNATSLVPDGNEGALVPKRCSLTEMLNYFLEFRFQTVKRRLEYRLRQLERRIHILEGYVIVFDGLDKALKIIRASTGKSDARVKMMQAFPLDEDQTNAVLELALYRISSLEIDDIREELAALQKEAKQLRTLLKSPTKMWDVVRRELEQIAKDFPDKRRTDFGSSEEITEFDAAAYIVKENTNVVITKDGWVKRLGKVSEVNKLRVREGDRVLEVLPASTLDTVIFYSSDGVAYTIGVDQIPSSTGYGEPWAKYFKIGDGATLVAAITTDPRFTYEDYDVVDAPTPGPHVAVATARGQVMRVSLSPFRQASTKSGRKYCRVRKGDSVVHVEIVDPETDTMFLASKNARIIHIETGDIPILGGAGIGVRGIKLATDDVLLGARKLSRPSDVLRVMNTNDNALSFGQMKYGVTGRGGKGVETSKRAGFKEIVPPDIELVDWTQVE